MKTSITMISFSDHIQSRKMKVEEFIDISAGYGVDAVDILEYYWQDKENEIKAVPGILKSKGLGIGVFCVGNNFVVRQEDRKKQIEYVKEGVRTAARLGATRLRIFGGSRSTFDQVREEDRLPVIIECIGKCIDTAKENNITLVIENHGGVPIVSDQLLEIIKSINSPYLKVNFDIGNFLGTGGEDPMSAARKLYPYVDFIHVKDLVRDNASGNRYKPCITGEGVVPVKECLEFFRQKGYDGYASLEYEAWDTMESMEGVRRSLEYLKKIVK